MKKTVLFAAIVAISISVVSCNSNSPEAVAQKFVTSVLHGDFATAKTLATEGTKKQVEMMADFAPMIPDSIKASNRKITVKIKDVKVDGDKAVAVFTTSEQPGDQKLNLVKKEGKWLAEWNKQDDMGEAEEAGLEMSDAPASETTEPASSIDSSANRTAK